MEHRSLSVVALLIALSGLSGFARGAAEDNPEQVADWTRRLESAAQLVAEAARQQIEADKELAAKGEACFKKFQVNACRDEARREHAVKTHEARRVENEGKALERQVKKEQLSEKDARHAAEADQRAADLKVRETETAGIRANLAAEEASRRAEKEKEALEGAKRRAHDMERVQKKQAAHAAKVAAKMEEAKRRQAEAAGR